VIITVLAGNIVYTNPRFTEVTGYMAEEVHGRNPRFLKTGHTQSVEYKELWQTLLAGEIWRGEMLNRKQDGSTYWAAVAIAPIRDELGAITGFVSLQEDITARKEAEDQLVAAKEVAEAANRAKSDFLSVISHELRTPLTSMKGGLDLLAANAKVQEALRGVSPRMVQMLNIATNNTDRLLKLVNDLLDFQRLERGKLELKLQTIALKELLEMAVESDRAYAEKLNVRFVLGEIPAEMTAWADPDRIRQIIANLLSNAAKFSHDGGQVEISAIQQDNAVRISVQDHGEGIPVEFRGRIFNQFTQADSSATRQKGGTGLGLAITKRLVEAMGGEIGFTSEVGVGTTFWFTLLTNKNNQDN
jgi:PAS domain S-box-containing protein